MLQLDNRTPFAADFSLIPNEQGVDTLYVIVKATFSVAGRCTLTDKQIPVCKEDIYWGEPGRSSLRYPSDVHVGKAATDIIVVGAACTPNGKPQGHLNVTVKVGAVTKVAVVFGDRLWQNGRMTIPEPFVTMPLVYERAFGGKQLDGDGAESDPRNPVGQFLFARRQPAVAEGAIVPNIEDPRALILGPGDRPSPVGFGAVAPHWAPRATYAGTYDDAWAQSRAPFLPSDFDKRFCNAASASLVYPGWLQGGEPVAIHGMHQEPLEFQVPMVGLMNRISVAGKVVSPPLQLETLLLEPNARQLSLVWRSALAVSKDKLRVESVAVSLSRH